MKHLYLSIFFLLLSSRAILFAGNQELWSHIKNADALIILGPADMDKNFKKELELFHKSIDEKVILVKKVDSMTENQLIALVKQLF